MTKVFVNERSEFFAVANDVKIQITFNKDVVSSYRLIGYENRVLNNDDFENDQKDAGEIGAGQTVTALYEIVPQEGYDLAAAPDVALFDVRYKEALGEASAALSMDVKDAGAAGLSSELSFAAAVASYGMLLRQSPYLGSSTYDMACELAENGLAYDPFGYRADFINVVKAASKLVR